MEELEEGLKDLEVADGEDDRTFLCVVTIPVSLFLKSCACALSTTPPRAPS